MANKPNQDETHSVFKIKLPPSGISLWIAIIVASILFFLYQLKIIPDTQLAAGALALLIAYVIYEVPNIAKNSSDISKITNKVEIINNRMNTIGSGALILKDTEEFYKQLCSIISSTSKVDVTYFTPNIPSEFIDYYGTQYWNEINLFLKNKTPFRLRRIATIENGEKLNWLLDTINKANNPPGYHLHYLNIDYKYPPLNVNIIDDEHSFIFDVEARSKTTEYIYIRDKKVATTLKKYFDLLWAMTPVLGESGRLQSGEIVKLKSKFGIAYGNSYAIGILDSGIGGLSVVNEINRLLPKEDIIYFADQAHIPFGDRSINEVKEICDGIVKYLIDQDVKIIVIACNTATASSLSWLRGHYPSMNFIGMVPPVKPASEITKNKKIGVLATPATFSTELFASLVSEFAKDIDLIKCEFPGLIAAIENGDIRTQLTYNILKNNLEPALNQGIDSIVIGCTHLVFVSEEIRQIVGPNVEIIDSSEAIARQVSNILQKKGLAKLPEDASRPGQLKIITSGDKQKIIRVMKKIGVAAEYFLEAKWEDGKLNPVNS